MKDIEKIIDNLTISGAEVVLDKPLDKVILLEFGKQCYNKGVQDANEIAYVVLPSHPHFHGSKNINSEQILKLQK